VFRVNFRNIEPKDIPDNVFQLISQDWFLIAAGDKTKCNMMTASWGGLGELWNKKVCYIFVRPERYTREFIENNSHFTLNFFEEEQREALTFCGTNSGRDIDKIEKCELTPIETANKTIYFKESRLVIECKKIYSQDIDPKNFLSDDIHEMYPKKDYHRMYIGEIVNVLDKVEE